MMKTWQAWGLIAAETLPTTNLYLNDKITIEPLSEERKAELLREPGQLNHFLWQTPTYFSAVYGQIIVRSSHAIWFRVGAEERSEAEEAIFLDLLPSALAALTCLSNQMPPRVEIIRLGMLVPGGLNDLQSPWRGGTTGGYETHAMSDEEMIATVSRTNAVIRSSKVKNIALQYIDARRQHDLAEDTSAAFATLGQSSLIFGTVMPLGPGAQSF